VKRVLEGRTEVLSQQRERAEKDRREKKLIKFTDDLISAKELVTRLEDETAIKKAFAEDNIDEKANRNVSDKEVSILMNGQKVYEKIRAVDENLANQFAKNFSKALPKKLQSHFSEYQSQSDKDVVGKAQKLSFKERIIGTHRDTLSKATNIGSSIKSKFTKNENQRKNSFTSAKEC
jgi:hypothetical protein